MKKVISVFALVGLMVASLMAAEEKPDLVRGEDYIVKPAIGEVLCVNNLFQSNMVLQRDKPVQVWGWAAAGEEITVTFAGNSVSAKAADDRLWKVELPAMPASAEGRKMVIKDKSDIIALENILVGDIWVLGGQSNMEFEIAKVQNGQLEIASANLPEIRLLSVPQGNGPDYKKSFPLIYQWSGWSKRHFRKGFWDVCSPETVREMSAIGYVFARRIHLASQVPIGVVDASRGGTTVETWTPHAVLDEIDTPVVKAKLEEWNAKVTEFDPKTDLENRIKQHEAWVKRMKEQGKDIPANRKAPTGLRPGPAMDQNRPGNCYASMMAPLEGLAVKGAIWHQGYNNCFDGSRGGAMYYQVFPKMIAAWRAAFGDPGMPFGIITLCTQGTKQTRDNFCSQMADAGAYIREAQYKTFADMRNAGDTNIGFAVTYDLRRRWYHPQLKIPAGERIARWALATQYGFAKDVRWEPPVITKVEAKDGAITLTFNQNTGGVDDGGAMEGFAIAGADGRFHPADIRHLVIGKDSRGRDRKDLKALVLKSAMVPEPVHYRYAWARSPMANIQAHHNTDIPIGTQRSDDWTIADMYTALTGKEPKEAGSIDRAERGELSKALRAEDTARRIKESMSFLEKHAEKEEGK